MDSKGAISSFWGVKIPPKKSIHLDFPPETILKVTSFAFGAIESNEPSKITAKVNTLLIADEDSIHGNECDALQNGEIVLGTLTPNKIEQIQVDLQFSPLDIIEVFNSGPNEVHLSGCLEPIDSDFDEEEEEEEAAEKAAEDLKVDPDTIQGRFSKMAASQPPKPAFQKKKKNKKKKNKKKDDDEANEEGEDNDDEINDDDDGNDSNQNDGDKDDKKEE